MVGVCVTLITAVMFVSMAAVLAREHKTDREGDQTACFESGGVLVGDAMNFQSLITPLSAVRGTTAFPSSPPRTPRMT